MKGMYTFHAMYGAMKWIYIYIGLFEKKKMITIYFYEECE